MNTLLEILARGTASGGAHTHHLRMQMQSLVSLFIRASLSISCAQPHCVSLWTKTSLTNSVIFLCPVISMILWSRAVSSSVKQRAFLASKSVISVARASIVVVAAHADADEDCDDLGNAGLRR